MRSVTRLRSPLTWSPTSYLGCKCYIKYFSQRQAVYEEISTYPPIVSASRCMSLREQLAACEKKSKILFHSGDCAESFQDATQSILREKVKYYMQCSDQIHQSTGRSAVIVGRIAGQYAKPRSQQYQTINHKQVHSYKGDNVNDLRAERQPNAKLQKQGYVKAVMSHNYLLAHAPNIYISHEGLILPYQAALTKLYSDQYYCLSAHMLWVGERTRQLDGAHIEFFRGVMNPIGIKISSKITKQQFSQLVHTLNPNNICGKLLVIIRMGQTNIGKLKQLIEVKVKQGLNFLFVSDPMHGNTSVLANGLKTRAYSAIMNEIKYFSEEMRRNQLGFGLSIEATYDETVRECHDGEGVQIQDITQCNYKSKCDPRLNSKQVMKLIKQVTFM